MLGERRGPDQFFLPTCNRRDPPIPFWRLGRFACAPPCKWTARLRFLLAVARSLMPLQRAQH
jgi:hypothetical protein